MGRFFAWFLGPVIADLRAELEAQRERSLDLWAQLIATRIELEVSREETAMLRRCLEVRSLDIPGKESHEPN